MLPDHASPRYHIGCYRFIAHPTGETVEFSTSIIECTESRDEDDT